MGVLRFTESQLRIVFMGDNYVAQSVIEFLEDYGENIVLLLRDKSKMTARFIAEYNPDVIITCYWPYLLPKEIINIPKYGCINFHPALLPKNRGWYPSVWEVIDGGVAGVTLHLIDEGADTGPIIAQRAFAIEEGDTGGSVYNKSMKEMISLFKETWERLRTEAIILTEQNHDEATYHSKADANCDDLIFLDEDYNAKYLLNLIKAKTFGDKSYAYYVKNGKRYYVKIEIQNG